MKKGREALLCCIPGVEIFLLFFLSVRRLRSQENDCLEYSTDMFMMAQDNESGLEVRESTTCIESTDQGEKQKNYYTGA